MSSWEGSACYPRSTFYPLSDGPSMRNRRINYAQVSFLFDLYVSQSSALMPLHSAAVCHRPEGTFRSLRLRFWRRPPQSNYPPSNVLANRELEAKCAKASISTTTPRRLRHRFSVPDYPTHRTPGPNAKAAVKGSRGSFRPVAGNRHLHRYYNFHRAHGRDSVRIITHSCRSNLPTRNFATLGPL